MKYVLVVDHLIESIPSACCELIEKGLLDEVGLLFLTRHPERYTQIDAKGLPLVVEQCSFEDVSLLDKLIAPYKEQIVCVICRGDKQVQFLRRLVPFLPSNVKVASVEALKAATNKRLMREAFEAFAPDVTPSYVRVHDGSPSSADRVESAMKYPVIVKPASLVSSLLIQKCENRTELEAALSRTFEAIETIYKREDRKDETEVIVEEYLEGNFYSIDAYVRGAGEIYYCPPVAYIPAQKIGIDDFFLYKRFVPTDLSSDEIEASNEATKKALNALGLTYSSAHVELIKTVNGWKIIEIGPRLGRFRNAMYRLGYGINHSLNDIAIHLDLEPVIPTTLRQYSSAYSIYPDQEGEFVKIENIDQIKNSELVHSMKTFANSGDKVTFAKNGGKALAEFIIASSNKEAYDELVHFVENNVKAVIKY